MAASKGDEMKRLNRKDGRHRNLSPPNFTENGQFYLVRCFECGGAMGTENYIPLVASGQCAFCGWHPDKENEDGKGREETA